ncbi:MAG TPA: YdcF family protein [Methylomirabilota bacterium]|jgi:uncharacterized SAM-binding protein YcdF (DUF218 family)|nr:YdcF family protein [Methylomirabilota bacterium]
MSRLHLRWRVERMLDAAGATVDRLGLGGLVSWLGRRLLVGEELRARPFIVVLCGGCRSSGRLNEATCRRVEYGVELWRRGLAPSLILSGGRPTPHRPSCAPRMKALAEALGVPASRIMVEDRSRRTIENAREVTKLVRAAGAAAVLLVTSPLHMRRAKLCFEKRGLNVSCAPAAGLPAAGATPTKEVLHEYLGLAYYRAQRWL